MIALVLFALFSSVIWRLRGGAFTTLTKLDPGTDGARAIAAVGIPLVLALYTSRLELLLLAPAIFVGVAADGWQPFQEMGLPVANPEASWLRWLPLHLGLRAGTFWHDFVGMAECGVLCLAPSALVGFAFGYHGLVALAAGLFFAPAYALARLGFPTIPNFAQGQSWGEIFAGAVVGAGLFLTFA
ncbi:MAG: hypothetical protein ACLGP3_10450 [Acidobacteriota bacterium]